MGGRSGIGSTIIGPLYIFRNVITGFPDAAIKMGHESSGTTYIYHNTIYTTSAGNGPSDSAGYDGIGNVISRNNIYQVGRYVMEIIGTDLGGNSYDYDNMYTIDASDPPKFVKWHNTRYDSLSAFQGTGQELNAISADSQFIDPGSGDFNLQSISPCIEAGVVLLGFNDESSPWAYKGSAPDVGAFEYDMLTSWDSYSDPEHNNQWDVFSGDTHILYMHGEGAVNGYVYRIVFWGPAGDQTRTEDKAGESGVLSLAGHDFYTDDPEDAGYWHVVVYPTNYSVPESYDPDDSNIIIDDTSYTNNSSFYVDESAIPEFPTVLTAIIVVGLCFGIYYWMRKRRLISGDETTNP